MRKVSRGCCAAKRRCPKCGTAMDSYLVDEKRKLHICGNNPDCAGFEVEAGEFRIKGYDGPLIECDKCGSDMQLKSGRFGKYFGCTNNLQEHPQAASQW
jgi:DNA topoisomerase I